jgi:hypothetical protein
MSVDHELSRVGLSNHRGQVAKRITYCMTDGEIGRG